jgi:hypothetical protein
MLQLYFFLFIPCRDIKVFAVKWTYLYAHVFHTWTMSKQDKEYRINMILLQIIWSITRLPLCELCCKTFTWHGFLRMRAWIYHCIFIYMYRRKLNVYKKFGKKLAVILFHFWHACVKYVLYKHWNTSYSLRIHLKSILRAGLYLWNPRWVW